MEFQCLALFFSLIVILMAAQAALPPEVYWERMLPNTPIPKVIREFPKLDGVKEITSQDRFLRSGYGVKKNELQDGVEESNLFPFYLYSNGVKKNELQDGVEESNLFPFYLYSNDVKKNELQDRVEESNLFPFYLYSNGVKKKELQDDLEENNLFPFYLYSNGVKKNGLQDDVEESNLFPFYLYSNGVKRNELQNETPYEPQAKENAVLRRIGPVANHHLHDYSKPSLYFSEERLRRGAKLDVQFAKRKFVTPLLPREITQRLPFSSEKVNEILEIMAVKPESKNAENMKKTLNICEEPGNNGEEKQCATSVESMVDFVTSKLGNNVHVTSTEIESKSQKFIVKDGVKVLAEEEIIACHTMSYPYVVFYCHKILNTTAHFMPLEGEDGTRVNELDHQMKYYHAMNTILKLNNAFLDFVIMYSFSLQYLSLCSELCKIS